MAKDIIPMTKSGHCQWPSEGSHERCRKEDCTCDCHKTVTKNESE